MKRFQRVGRGLGKRLGLRRVAKSAEVSGEAPIPNSGFDSIENSQNASTTVAGISRELGDAIYQYTLEDGELDEHLGHLMHQLELGVEKYDNSKVPYGDKAYPEFSCTESLAQLISNACKCAMGAYIPSENIAHTDHFAFRRDSVTDPSLDGTIKGLTSTVVSPKPGWDGETEFHPVLVIAIRGSASGIDHIVNASAQPKDAGDFVGSSIQNSGGGILAHTGFLSCAKALQDIVLKRIQAVSKGQDGASRPGSRPERRLHVAFTGHSAGGAVASLLFCHFLSDEKYASSTQFSCITFGAPPCVSAPVDVSRFETGGRVIACLNIINEFDLVARADKRYAEELAKLLKSLHDTPSVPLDPAPRTDVGLTSSLPDAQDDPLYQGRKVYPLCIAIYQHIGPRILLLRRRAAGLPLVAVQVKAQEFENLLFCRLAVHKKGEYSQRVLELENGQVNGHDGWERGLTVSNSDTAATAEEVITST